MTNDAMLNDEVLAVPLYPDESVEDLQRQGLRIIQKKDGFRFGEDAVLLAHGVHRLWDATRRGACSFVEFGSHCGVVSILFAALSEGATGIGLELASRQVDVMQRNIVLNRQESRLSASQVDVAKLADGTLMLPAGIRASSYDFVIANPPYGLYHAAPEAQDDIDAIERERLIARFEVAITFEQMARAAAKLLRSRGRFVFIHRTDRLPELFSGLEKARLRPSEMTLISSRRDTSPGLVLIAAVKDGRIGGFRIHPQLHVREADNSYAPGMQAIYGNPQVLSSEDLMEGLVRVNL